MELCLFCSVLILFVLYKILDRLIRVPFIGCYNERYIFVTGCDTGFGNGIAKRLDKIGCHVFAGCLTEKGETELKKVTSERLLTIPLDISKPESVQKAYEFVKSRLPEGKGLWGLLNNAGILGASGEPEWFTINNYRAIMDVNLFGTIDVTMTFLSLIKLEHGRVVNTSSLAGRISFPGSLPYNISKYGVEAFTDGLRRSLRVFSCKALLIEPGHHLTPIIAYENMERSMNETWQQTSQETRDKFGDEYFNTVKQTVLSMATSGICSSDVTNVVNAYEHALLGRFPRARYLVGKDAIYFFWPMMLMPEWMSDWLVEKCMNKPLPSILKKKIE